MEGGLVLVRSTFRSLDTIDVGTVPLCIAVIGRLVFYSRDGALVLMGDGVSLIEKDFLQGVHLFIKVVEVSEYIMAKFPN